MASCLPHGAASVIPRSAMSRGRGAMRAAGHCRRARCRHAHRSASPRRGRACSCRASGTCSRPASSRTSRSGSAATVPLVGSPWLRIERHAEREAHAPCRCRRAPCRQLGRDDRGRAAERIAQVPSSKSRKRDVRAVCQRPSPARAVRVSHEPCASTSSTAGHGEDLQSHVGVTPARRRADAVIGAYRTGMAGR